MITRSDEWAIPRRVWAILFSWGLGVLVIAGLLSFWIWKNEQDQEREEAQIQLEQDRAMCAIVRAFVEAPEPPPGPEGQRAREFRDLMERYRVALHCQELEQGVSPARERDRD